MLMDLCVFVVGIVFLYRIVDNADDLYVFVVGIVFLGLPGFIWYGGSD